MDDNVAGRTDYAINLGEFNEGWPLNSPGGAPGVPKANYNFAYPPMWNNWKTTELGWTIPDSTNPVRIFKYTGVSFRRSEVGMQNVTDGTSRTYLIGEKYLNPDEYDTGKGGADNETWCTGFNNDNFRSAFDLPEQDRPGFSHDNRFGSAHSAGWFASWCDGHVELVSYDIDLMVHRGDANRADDGSPLGAP